MVSCERHSIRPLHVTTAKNIPQAAKSNGSASRVHLRYTFYRDGFRILIVLLAGSVLLNVVLGLTLRIVAAKPTIERYFTVGANNEVTKIVALKEPFITPARLHSWVTESVIASYSLDPVNISEQVERLRDRYTRDGHAKFKDSLVRSGTYDLMKRRTMILSASQLGTPALIKEGVEDGVYTWHLRMPVLVQFQSSSAQTQQKRMVEVTVVRVYGIENDRGFALNDFSAQDI